MNRSGSSNLCER